MKKTNSQEPVQPILLFKSSQEWNEWLNQNYTVSNGVWLQFYKKASGKKTFAYAEALDVALCYGWIDGQSKSIDEEAYLQRFTPRRSKSIWSKKNIENIERLTKEGRMHSSGLKEVAAAKADGRWENAYDSPGNMSFPEDFLAILSKNKKALAFFDSLNRANKYAIAWRLQTAKKPETREKRMDSIIKMLNNGEKFH